MSKDYLEDSGGGWGYFPYNTVNDYHQWSQELRLSGGAGHATRWQVGAYHLEMKTDTFQSVAGALILGGTSDAQKLSTYGNLDARNTSFFGQVEHDFAPGWTVIGGLRWSVDDKSLDMWRVYEDPTNNIAPAEVFNLASVNIPGINQIGRAHV